MLALSLLFIDNHRRGYKSLQCFPFFFSHQSSCDNCCEELCFQRQATQYKLFEWLHKLNNINYLWKGCSITASSSQRSCTFLFDAWYVHTNRNRSPSNVKLEHERSKANKFGWAEYNEKMLKGFPFPLFSLNDTKSANWKAISRSSNNSVQSVVAAWIKCWGKLHTFMHIHNMLEGCKRWQRFVENCTVTPTDDSEPSSLLMNFELFQGTISNLFEFQSHIFGFLWHFWTQRGKQNGNASNREEISDEKNVKPHHRFLFVLIYYLRRTEKFNYSINNEI